MQRWSGNCLAIFSGGKAPTHEGLATKAMVMMGDQMEW